MKDKGEMGREDIINFCDVCIAYVKTEECTKMLNDAYKSEGKIKKKITLKTLVGF